MAGQSASFERDMVMMMTKLTDLINKQIAAQGAGNKDRRLDLTIGKIAAALGKTPAQLEELNRVFLSMNKSGEELSEHISFVSGASKNTVLKLRTLNKGLDRLSDSSSEFADDLDDVGDALEHFDKAAASMTKSIEAANSGLSDFEARISNLIAAIKEDEEALKNLTSTTNELTDEQLARKNALEQSLEAHKEEFKALTFAIDATRRVAFASDRLALAHKQITSVSIQSFDKMGDFNIALDRINKQNKGLADMTARVARSSALQNAAQIEFSRELDRFGADFMGYKDALRDASKQVPAAMLRMAGMFDDQTKSIKDNLDPEDFAKLRVTLGETKVMAAESLKGVEGVSNVQDLAVQAQKLGSPELLDKGNDKLRTAILGLAQQLEASGAFKASSDGVSSVKRDDKGVIIGLKDATQLTDAQFKQLAKEIAAMDKVVDETTRQLDHLGAVSQTAVGKHYFMMKAAGGAGGMLKKLAADLGTTAIFLGSLNKAVDANKAAFNFLSEFNIAQVPASLKDVATTSVALGVSMEDAIKMMQENKRTLAIQGADAFAGTRDAMGQTFKQLGYSAKQSMDMIGPGIEAAISSGVSVRDPAGLNTYIDSSMKSFKNISGIVNTTAKEYLELNAQLMKDNDIMAVSMGMSQDQQAVYAKSLEEQRNSLVVQGMALDQAQELVKAREAEKRQKFVGKYREAALAGAQLQMMGFSGQDASEFTRIKTVGPRNKEEADFYNNMMKQMVAQKDAELGAARATGDIGALAAAQTKYDVFSDKTGDLREDSYRQLNVADRNKTAMTNGEAAAAGEKAKGSANFATASNVINSITSLLDNVFTKAIWSSTIALVGFTAQLARAGGIQGLAGMAKDAIGGFKGGKGIGGKILGMGKGLLGMGGGALAAEGAVAGTAALGAGAAGTAAAGTAAAGAGALGWGAKALKFGGKLAKGVGIGAIGGLLGDYIADSGDENIAKAKESGDKISGTDLAKSVAGKAASWGAKGAAIGSIIPGVGTLIGGGLGALAGGAAGLFQNADNISQWWSQDKKLPQALPGKVGVTGATVQAMQAATPPSQVAAVPGATAPAIIASPGNTMPGLLNDTASTKKTVNKQSDSTDQPALMQVSDATANKTLDDIAKSMTDMLAYLKEMSETGVTLTNAGPVRLADDPRARQIPLASQYISGRQSA